MASLIDLLTDWFNDKYKYQLVNLTATTWYIYITLNSAHGISSLPILVSNNQIGIPELRNQKVELNYLEPSNPRFFELLEQKINTWSQYGSVSSN